MRIWGATTEQWEHFNLYLGLGEDMLPVVSNPDAVISAASTLKDKGKVPSLYNAAGDVVGMAEWTSRRASASDIALWSAQPDYGICIQTRALRAIDIDITNAALVEEIVAYIHGQYDMPVRTRANSPKCLLVCLVKGDIPKRVVKTSGGMIEFLGNGQQFIAAGTHPSGVTYDWLECLPVPPELTVDQYTALCNSLAEKFGIEEMAVGTLRKPKTGLAVRDDAMVTYLTDKALVLSRGREGQVYIKCPFSAEHTSDSSPTATCYMPEKGRGYERGHFKCLHAHCAGRKDEDFEIALGYRLEDFAVLQVSQGGTGVDGLGSPLPLPPFQRNQSGMILSTVDNVQMGLSRSDVCGWQIAYDTFKGEIVLAPHGTVKQWRELRDTDFYQLRINLEANSFRPVSKEIVRDAVYYVANENSIDTAKIWLTGLTWDGVPRVERFMIDYMKSEDTEYSRAMGLYMWTAMAGRVMVPGCKADMVPIWEGSQGVGKSRAVSALVPDPMFTCEVGFHENEDNLSRKMKGVLVAEISELRGLHTRDLETIKAFVSKTEEKWVPKYQERAITYPRRLIFIGTTNQDELLSDNTGNRRWLPIRTGDKGGIDVAAIVRDRAELWAEGRELFAKGGVSWLKAEALSVEVHDSYQVTDVWEDVIERWLNTAGDLDGKRPADEPFLTLNEVLEKALGFSIKNVTRGQQMRAAQALKNCNYDLKKTTTSGKRMRVYIPKS